MGHGCCPGRRIGDDGLLRHRHEGPDRIRLAVKHGADSRGGPGRRGDLPAGVTTKINVPSHSTEEEYFQACHAAKTWMQGHPGDRTGLVERYLAAVQTPGVFGAGTWNIAWAALPLPRQAGVIVAARAAANDECG